MIHDCSAFAAVSSSEQVSVSNLICLFSFFGSDGRGAIWFFDEDFLMFEGEQYSG